MLPSTSEHSSNFIANDDGRRKNFFFDNDIQVRSQWESFLQSDYHPLYAPAPYSVAVVLGVYLIIRSLCYVSLASKLYTHSNKAGTFIAASVRLTPHVWRKI